MHLLLVDDHPLFREALRSIVRLGVPDAVVREADSIASANATLARHPGTDLIVLDLSMSGTSGFDGLLGLRARHPRIPILICSALEEPRFVREALALGAAGFVPKSAPKAAYLAAIEQIMAGATYVPEAGGRPCGREAGQEPGGRDVIRRQISSLTPTQMKVLGLIKLGKINKQIAYELSIGDSMVKAHVSEIMRKLNVRNRTQIALCASTLDFDRVGL